MAFIQTRQPFQVPYLSQGTASQYIQRFQTGLYVQRNPLISPGNRPDTLIDGLNCELSNNMSMTRRAGFSKYSTANFGPTEVADQFSSWIDASGNYHVITDTNTELADLQPTTLNQILNKTYAVPSYVQGVGGTLYIAAGTNGNYRWSGSGAVTQWGINGPTAAPSVTSSPGSLSPQFGYKWLYVWRDANTGAVSNPSPLSNFEPTAASVEYHVTVTGTSQSRVTNIDIYRTDDGGSTYFYDGTVSNPGPTTAVYVDNNPDTSLVLTQQAPAIGIASPPPAGIQNLAYSQGRLWGNVGGILYFNAGPDALQGIPAEEWPALYYFIFPQAIVKLVPTPVGLLVWLPSQVWIIRGTSTTTFFPSLWQDRLGIASYNAIYQDGDTMYAFTTDRQFVKIDQNGLLEMGFPIGTIIQNINPATAWVTIFRQGTQENAVYLSDGVSTYYRFNLNLQAWDPPAVPAGGLQVLAAVLTSPGTYNLLLAPSLPGSFVLRRNNLIWTDILQGAPTTYASFFTVGSIVLAELGRLAEVDNISVEYMPLGTPPTLYAAINAIGPQGTAVAAVPPVFIPLTGAVADPPEFPISTTLPAVRYYLKQQSTPPLMRHMQVRVQFSSTDNVKNEVVGLGVLSAGVK